MRYPYLLFFKIETLGSYLYIRREPDLATIDEITWGVVVVYPGQ